MGDTEEEPPGEKWHFQGSKKKGDSIGTENCEF